MKSNSSTYSFMDCAFGVVFKKFLPNPDRYKVTRFSPGFFLKVLVLGFVIHSEFLYMFILSAYGYPIVQHHFFNKTVLSLISAIL